MRAGFEFKTRINILSRYARDDFLIAAMFSGVMINDLDIPSMGIGVIVVHAEKIAGENGRFIAAGRGANFKKYIAIVVRIFRQQQGLDFRFELFNQIPRIADFLLGQLADGRIFVREHGARGFQLIAGMAIVGIEFDQRVDLGVFLRKLAEFILFADDFGVGQ